MATYQLLLCLVFCFCLASCSKGTADIANKNGGKKLFVFGDSFVDTGNSRANVGSMLEPYGITYPGKPTGRFSDGRCITDYIASYFGVHAPIPYKRRAGAKKSELKNGINFAYGGSGLFADNINSIGLSMQIDHLKTLIDEKLYNQTDINSSVAFIHTSGNDYTMFQKKSPRTPTENSIFMKKVIKELARNLKTLYDLGVPKVAVLTLPPGGCFPQSVKNSSIFPKCCDQSVNKFCQTHNQMLKLAVKKLNKEVKGQQPFVLINTYNAFLKAMNKHARTTEDSRYKNPSTACCRGATPMACGLVDSVTGKKNYTLCDHPQMSFFFDIVHPAQHGSRLVSIELRDALKQLLST